MRQAESSNTNPPNRRLQSGDQSKLGGSGQLALKQAQRPQHAGSLLHASALLDAVPGVTGVDPGTFRIMEADGSSVVCVQRPHIEQDKH